MSLNSVRDGMGEVVAVGRQALDGRFARPQDALVIHADSRLWVLDDLVSELAIDRSTEPVHADSHSFRPLPGHSR